jgi:RimJ/RimL family protein N-acetyltransferase
MKKTDELRFVRAMSPDIVPHYLIEQVRDRNYSVEDFFKYQQINCMSQTAEGFKINPFNHLYVLANPENIVKGVLWMVVDALSKDIVIQTYSIDKEYWNKGYAVKKIADHVKEIVVKGNLNKIYWVTNYEKHSMRYGFSRSKSILMEYDPKKEEKKEKPKVEKGNDKSDE